MYFWIKNIFEIKLLLNGIAYILKMLANCHHVTRDMSMAFCSMLQTHAVLKYHSQPNECVSDYINHRKSHFRIKAKVYNTSDHWKTDARPNLARLFQLTAGKVSHFQFQCNVRLLLWFSLWIVKVRKKKKHPPNLNLYLTKNTLDPWFFF